MTFQVWGITDVCLAEPVIIETPLNESVTILRTKKKKLLGESALPWIGLFWWRGEKSLQSPEPWLGDGCSTVWNNYSEFLWIFSVQIISKQATERSWSSPATVMLSKNSHEHVSCPGVRGGKTGWEHIRKNHCFLIKIGGTVRSLQLVPLDRNWWVPKTMQPPEANR